MTVKKTFQSIGEIIETFDPFQDKYISHEFQKYGYDLAKELGDLPHKALYIKLAKEMPRVLLEQARNFVKDAGKVNSRAKLFMWKLTQLKRNQKQKSRGRNGRQ